MARDKRVFSSIYQNSLLLRLMAASLAAGTLSGCLGYDGVITRGAVIDQKRVTQVKPGMEAPQVLSILGTPSTTSTVGGDAWYYVSQRVDRSLAFMPGAVTDQRVLAVYFDKSKKYSARRIMAWKMASLLIFSPGQRQSQLRNITCCRG